MAGAPGRQVFLSGIVGMIFSRVLRTDLQKYTADAPEDPQALREDTGWKVRARPPLHRCRAPRR